MISAMYWKIAAKNLFAGLLSLLIFNGIASASLPEDEQKIVAAISEHNKEILQEYDRLLDRISALRIGIDQRIQIADDAKNAFYDEIRTLNKSLAGQLSAEEKASVKFIISDINDHISYLTYSTTVLKAAMQKFITASYQLKNNRITTLASDEVFIAEIRNAIIDIQRHLDDPKYNRILDLSKNRAMLATKGKGGKSR